jgi:restriction system protein
MPIPDFQTLMLPVLKLAAEKEWRVSETVGRLADDFGLSPEDRTALLPSGRQTTFSNRVAWAKSYLVQAGLIQPTAKRAHFIITEQGRKVLENPPDRITVKFLNQFPEFRRFREPNEPDSPSKSIPAAEQFQDASLTPDEVMRNAHTQLENVLAEDLLAKIRVGTPAFFESLVVQLLVAMKYGGSAVDIKKALVGRSGDGGVDGVIDQDVLRAGSDLRASQALCGREHGGCKCHSRFLWQPRSI